MKLLECGHRLLNSCTKYRKRLLRALPDAEKLIIGNKTSTSLLLDIEWLESGPSSSGVILVYLDVHPLVWRNIEHELTSSLVLLDIPSLLLLISWSQLFFLAIDEASKALGVQQSLHLFASCSVIVVIERKNAMRVVFRGHNGKKMEDGWKWCVGKNEVIWSWKSVQS